MLFFLGAHQPHWLELLDVPLCVSRARLIGRKSFPRAKKPWLLDSSAFSMLAKNGKWLLTAKEYAGEAALYGAEIGNVAHVAPQDWMCEPHMLKRTGLSVAVHQARTVHNFLELRALGVRRVFPVLQGWTSDDYVRHVDKYLASGVDLLSERLVGVGSVCRRQGEDEIAALFSRLHKAGLKRLHGFGVKTRGLEKIGPELASADSMAWSFCARREDPLPGCTSHINCANCEHYALMWRARLLATVEKRT